jgi:hypothetical protein
MRAAAAQGNLSVANSKSAAAIFRAGNIAPGDTVSGTVRLANRGTLAGDLNLRQQDLRDLPGPNGGRLSQALRLAVDDVTRPGSATPVYAGTLAALGDRPLGRFAPGESRTYRFTAQLPDRGDPPSLTGGDNAFAGSSVSVRYIWRTTAAVASPPGSLRLSVRLVKRRLLRRGILDVYVRCDRPCRVASRARLMKRSTRRRAVELATVNKRGRMRLRVSRRTRAQVKRQLRHRRVRVRVYVRAKDTAGNTRTVTRRFALRKRR